MTQAIIHTDLIDANPWQPRMSEDAEHLANLATSIADDGLMQIPSARKVGDRYQLAFGHSRLAAYKLLASLQKVELLSEICEPAESESAQARAWKAARTAADNLVDFDEMPLNVMDIDDETMFRFSIAENEQRKDLSAVERARAMVRYRDVFHKSSAEIGELFGCADATVRGTIRLLELPLDAQNLLDKGEISQGAARALLSMQRVASEKDIVETAKRIFSSGTSSTPETIVQDAIDRVALRMWRKGWDDGDKPRSGYKGWLLDMKNFPNKYLPELTLSELPDALLPGALGSKNGDPTWLGLLRIIAHSNDVVDASLKLGQSDDANLRELAGKIDILLDPPGCSTCPFYTKLDGSHYCGLRACHTRKRMAWEREKMLTASKTLGIEIYSEADGNFKPLEGYGQIPIFKRRGPDLRIIEREKIKSYPSQYGYDGVNTDVFCIVVVGKELERLKANRKEERALEKAGLTVIRGASDLISDKKERLAWEAAGYIGDTLFRDFSQLALNLLERSSYNWSKSGPTWAIPKRQTNDEQYPENFLRRKLALNMLDKQVGYDVYRMSIGKYAEALEQAIIILGLPKWETALSEMARIMQAEVDERFPEEKPKPVAVSVSAETVIEAEVQEVEAE